MDAKTIYCGCPIQWSKGSSGKPHLASCGYEIRRDSMRANRIEIEHIVPASNLALGMACWAKGGRTNCEGGDRIYNAMAGNLFNLSPSIGEVNADRNNLKMGEVLGHDHQYGQCESKVDFAARVFEPRDAVKGLVARTYFFMYDYYNLNMSKQQQQLFMAWDKQFPVTPDERERESRIAQVMGYHNEFVTGTKSWTLGYRPEGKGAKELLKVNQSTMVAGSGSVRGNKRSMIYHLTSCPSYDKVSTNNVVSFATEGQAVAAGYRKAGNCL